MTTIACNAVSMAADSRTSEDAIYYDTEGKIQRLGKSLIGCAGSLDSVAKFLEWFSAKRRPSKVPEFGDEDFEAIELNKHGIFVYANTCRPRKIITPACATGSGAMAAMAAMFCGKTPEEAVRVAILCDKNSGGPVVVLAL